VRQPPKKIGKLSPQEYAGSIHYELNKFLELLKMRTSAHPNNRLLPITRQPAIEHVFEQAEQLLRSSMRILTESVGCRLANALTGYVTCAFDRTHQLQPKKASTHPDICPVNPLSSRAQKLLSVAALQDQYHTTTRLLSHYEPTPGDQEAQRVRDVLERKITPIVEQVGHSVSEIERLTMMLAGSSPAQTAPITSIH